MTLEPVPPHTPVSSPFPTAVRDGLAESPATAAAAKARAFTLSVAIGGTPLVALCSVALSVVIMEAANEPPTFPAPGWMTAFVRLPSLVAATLMALWLSYVDVLFHRVRFAVAQSTLFRNALALVGVGASLACALLVRRSVINWGEAIDQWYRKEQIFRLAEIRSSSAVLVAVCGTLGLLCVVGARLMSSHPVLRWLSVFSAVVIIYWAVAYVVFLAGPFAEFLR